MYEPVIKILLMTSWLLADIWSNVDGGKWHSAVGYKAQSLWNNQTNLKYLILVYF